jgi:hypothetical protein
MSQSASNAGGMIEEERQTQCTGPEDIICANESLQLRGDVRREEK